jgi:hypothetical protein
MFDLIAETLDILSGAGDIFGILKAQRRDFGGKVDDRDDVSGDSDPFHDRSGSHLIIDTAE